MNLRKPVPAKAKRTCREMFTGAFLWLLTLALVAGGLNARSQTAEFNAVTLESFLQGSPTIAKAVFEKELFTPPGNSIPAGARKQIYSVKRDGTNYLFSSAGISAGRFNGIFWNDSGGCLEFHDPKINKQNAPMGDLGQWLVDVVANLGFPEINRDSEFTWDKQQNRLVAAARQPKGSHLVIHLNYDNKLPASATVEDQATGRVLSSLHYVYSPNFFAGKLPVEFTRYAGVSTNNEARLYAIRFQELEVTNGPIGAREMDPLQLSARRSIIIRSNDVSYEVLNGKLKRILTVQENNAQLLKIAMRRGDRQMAVELWLKLWCFPNGSISIFRVVLLCLPPAFCILSIIWLVLRRVSHTETR